MNFPKKFYHQLSIYSQIGLFLAWLLFSYSIEKTMFFGGLTVSAQQQYREVANRGDLRTQVLADFFAEKQSPLLGYESKFIQVADQYDLPWTLLPAIAGKESSYGKYIPYFQGKPSYNPFGWGVTGNQVIVFQSWSEAIEIVGRGLQQKYFNQGLTNLAEIEKRYTPPSYKTDHHWLRDVTFISESLQSRLTDKRLSYQENHLLAFDAYQ